MKMNRDPLDAVKQGFHEHRLNIKGTIYTGFANTKMWQ